jgi:hypothetical protein
MINWGQYHDADKTMRLIQSVLDGSRQPPTVCFVDKNAAMMEDDPVNNSLCKTITNSTSSHHRSHHQNEHSNVLLYRNEEDILNFYNILRSRKETDDEMHPLPQQNPKRVYIPIDVLRVTEREKGLVENDYGILFFTNEFKRVVCWHLAHFQDVFFYQSK